MRSKLILLVALIGVLTLAPSLGVAAITIPTSISDFTLFGQTSVQVDNSGTIINGRVGSNGTITLASNTTAGGDIWALSNVTLQDNGGATALGNIVSNSGLVSVATYGSVSKDVYGQNVTLANNSGKQAEVHGNVYYYGTLSQGIIDGTSTHVANLASLPVSMPAISLPTAANPTAGAVNKTVGNGTLDLTTPGSYGALTTTDSHSVVIFHPGTYIFSSIDLHGSTTVNVSADVDALHPVIIEVVGQVTTGTNVKFNWNDSIGPNSLYNVFLESDYSGSGNAISMGGGGDFSGIFFAPYDEIHAASGSGVINGDIWADVVDVQTSVTSFGDAPPVPEPASLIVWSLLGAGSWLGMRVWRRRGPGMVDEVSGPVRQSWSPEARQAIHDIITGGAPR